MNTATIIALAIAILIFVVALLYSTVGHAGASGYLAAMALFGVAPIVMKPTALTLNIIVALIGGSLALPDLIYKSIVGVVLLYSAVRLFFSARVAAENEDATVVPIWIALCLGAVLGLLSGLTGVGGGIFLSPVLLLMHWTTTKETSGVAAAFILVNSVAGLLGHVSAVSFVSNDITYWAPAALIGGWVGTELGTRVLPIAGIRRWLSVVLVLAGLKLISEAALILIRR